MRVGRRWCAIAFGLSCSAPVAGADTPHVNYPVRPIRIVVPNSPGSGADVFGRLIGSRLAQAWAQQAVIDNRAGATGSIGTEIVARAAPDGYTLLMMTSQQAIVAAMHETQPYDLVKDFVGTSLLASTPLILVVHPAVAASTVRELITLARAKPGQLNYGTPGAGSTSHLATALFESLSATRLVHVPYKGTTPALTDAMAGQVQLAVIVAPAVLPALKAGKLRALGVTSAKRSVLVPDVPAIAEFVPGYEWSGWYGLAAPRGTPGAIIGKLNAEQLRALQSPEFQERIAALGAEPIGTTAAVFTAYIAEQVGKMRTAIRLSGARPD